MSQPSNPRQLNEVETSAGALLQPMRFVDIFDTMFRACLKSHLIRFRIK